jgi:hypothetical protein
MNGHFLLFVLSPFDFDRFDIIFSSADLPSDAFSPIVLSRIRHLNLQIGVDLAIKNPQRSRLEFLRAWAISLKGSVQLDCLIYDNTIYQIKLGNKKIGSNSSVTWRVPLAGTGVVLRRNACSGTFEDEPGDGYP